MCMDYYGTSSFIARFDSHTYAGQDHACYHIHDTKQWYLYQHHAFYPLPRVPTKAALLHVGMSDNYAAWMIATIVGCSKGYSGVVEQLYIVQCQMNACGMAWYSGGVDLSLIHI